MRPEMSVCFRRTETPEQRDNMPEFKFLEDTHTYLLDGVKIPSVTSVLPYNYTGENEYQRDRGSKVHKMIELYNNGELDEDTLDPVLQPYLESYKLADKLEFDDLIIDYKSGSKHPCTGLQLAGYTELVKVNKNKIDVIGHEIKLYHPTYRYAGTIDYVHLTQGIDHKMKVFALYLQADGSKGKYEDHSKELRKNTGIFLSHLTAYKWQKEKGLI